MTDPAQEHTNPDFKTLVAKKVHQLWKTRELSSTKAQFAAFRNSATSDVLESPAIWQYILEDAPATRVNEDEPTHSERALHAILSLYCTHQQAKQLPMHLRGETLGKALRRLKSARGDSVNRKFSSLISSTDLQELRYHLLGLHKMLREQNIPVDYAQLGLELLLFQKPDHRNKVLLGWSRGYHSFATEPLMTEEMPKAQTAN